MNTDIRLQLSFFDHPKTKKLTFMLGPAAVLSLIRLFAHAAANKTDGRLTNMDVIDIALASNWEREAEEFVDGLVKIRFLDLEGDVYVIHDWAEHQPWIAGSKERSEQASNAARARWAKTGEQQAAGDTPTKNQQDSPENHAQSIDEQCGEQCSNENQQCPVSNTNSNSNSLPTPTTSRAGAREPPPLTADLRADAKEMRPDLSEEQIRQAWIKFRDRKAALRPDAKLAWIRWIQTEFDRSAGGSSRKSRTQELAQQIKDERKRAQNPGTPPTGVV